MFKYIMNFLDKLEDRVRGKLSRSPLLYALIGGVGIVLFWRGVWHTADMIPIIENGPVSIIVGAVILLITGIFVSAFVGNRLIMTGLKGEKKLADRTGETFETEEARIEKKIDKIESEMKEIEKEIHSHQDKK
jgi:hypothetical protein